jgi:hypothetical protein
VKESNSSVQCRANNETRGYRPCVEYKCPLRFSGWYQRRESTMDELAAVPRACEENLDPLAAPAGARVSRSVSGTNHHSGSS